MAVVLCSHIIRILLPPLRNKASSCQPCCLLVAVVCGSVKQACTWAAIPCFVAGYGTNADMRTCARCPVGWYSRGGQVGIAFCKPCPQLSTSNPTRTACGEFCSVDLNCEVIYPPAVHSGGGRECPSALSRVHDSIYGHTHDGQGSQPELCCVCETNCVHNEFARGEAALGLAGAETFLLRCQAPSGTA